ncbi:MAG: contractile injection system tape measure protein, partial [Bacteroidota bacterium]
MNVTSPSGSYELQQELSRWFQGEASEAISRLLDELLPADLHLRMDELVLDLGRVRDFKVAEYASKAAMLDRLLKTLREEVEHHRLRLNSQSLRQRSNLYPIDSKEEIIASTPNQYLSEQWLFFLENGYLPWWAPKSPTAEDLSLGIYEVLRLPHTTLREKLLALIHYSKTARIRLARDVRHQPIFRILLGQSKALTKLYQDWKSVMTTVVQRHQADATTDKISQVPQDWDYWARFHLWPALLELPSRHQSTSAVTAAFFDSVWPGLNHWSVEKVQNFTAYWSQKQRQQLLPVIWPKLSQAAIEYLLVESPLRESTFKKGQTKAEEEVTNREVEGVRTEAPGEDQAVKEVLTNQDIDQRTVEETFEEGQSIEQPEELTGAIDATT